MVVLIKLFFVFLLLSNIHPAFAQQRKPDICTGGVLNGKATLFPQPDYPDDAIEQKISGTVIVRVSIDEEGNVTEAKACSGDPFLRPEAEKAALKAKLEQTKLSDVPVKVSGILVYNFDLRQDKIINSGIVNGKAKYLPSPDYPKEAEQACAGGKVEVEVLIDEETETVISATAVSGHELLLDAAVQATKKAKFRRTPDVLPKKMRGIVVYNFDSYVKCLFAGFVNGKAVDIPAPNTSYIIHPKHLQIKKEEIVAVRIVVDIEGNIIRMDAISGHPLLRAPAIHSANRTKFSPFSVGTVPVRSSGILVFKFQPDGTVNTAVEPDDADVAGTPIDLVKPSPPLCGCRFTSENIVVEAKVDPQVNVTQANAVTGHPLLKNASEKAALKSRFVPTNNRANLTLVYAFEAVNEYREAKLLSVVVKKAEIEKASVIGHLPPLRMPIFAPNLEYPAAARAVGVKGEVSVEIMINENGNVEKARAISGHPLLRISAEKAALQTKYKPITLSDEPVKVKTVIVYNFN